MQFHEFDRTTGYEVLECVDNDAWFDILLALDGSSRAANWKPFRVRRVGKARKRPFRPSDSPYEGTYALFFRRSAVDALRDILDAHGELLPLEDEGGVELFLYNPRAIEALDQVLSIGSRDENGKLESASRPVFIPSVVEGVDIFKLAVPRAGTIYVSDRFVQRWKQAKLEGLDFKVVWDSDWPLPEPEPPEVAKPPPDEYICMEAYLQGLETSKRVTTMAEHARNNYATLKATAEGQVVRWEWASDTLHSYEPAYFEIHKFPRGKVLPTKPDPIPWVAYEYGYDAQGRVVVARQYTEFSPRTSERFFLHEPDGIMEISYNYDMADHDWTGVQWFTVRERRVVATHCLTSLGNIMSCTYQYDDQGRLIRRDCRAINTPSTTTEDWHELEYDAQGKIIRIHWCYPDGRRYLHFERVTRKTSFKTLKKELLQGLTAAIVDAIGRAGIHDEVYVLIVRDLGAGSEHALPPLLALNTVPERERLMQVHGDHGFEAIWNPCEWQDQWQELDVTLSPELAAMCASANQDIWQNERHEQAILFLLQLAQALNKAQLPIRRADEFVSILLFEEQGGLEEQVEQQITAKARKKLRRGGWLPG
jgi:YD repeat-containing protein